MKRLILLAALALAFKLFLGSSVAFSQATFKISFKFEVEDKSYPPGDYWIAQKEEGKITLRRETGGEEVLIPFIERIAQPDPPIKEPQLVFEFSMLFHNSIKVC